MNQRLWLTWHGSNLIGQKKVAVLKKVAVPNGTAIPQQMSEVTVSIR